MSQYFTNYNEVALSLAGFGLFAAVFFGAIIWVSLPANKKKYHLIANKILNDGDES